MSRADSIGIAPQTDLRTGATAVAYSPPVTQATPEMNRQTLDISETLGNRAPVAQEYGGRVFTNPMQGALRPRSGGLILAGFFGAPASTPNATAPAAFDHVYDSLANLPVLSSIWTRTDLSHIGQGAILDKYIGCVGNTLNLTCEANNYLLFEAGYVAREWMPDPPAPSFTRDTSGRWPFNRVTVEMAVGSGAYEATPAKAFSLAYSNDVTTDDYVLGGLFVDSLPLGDIELTGSFRPTRDIKGHTRRAMADAPEDIRLKLVATGPEIAPGVNFSFEVELFRLETLSAPGNQINAGETLRDVEVSWRAVLDDTSGKLVTVKLTNTENGSLYRAA